MKKIIIKIILCAGIYNAYAAIPDLSMINSTFSNALNSVESLDMEEADPALEALHEVLQNSQLYRVLLTMNMTVPTMTKVGEYVLIYNELHRMNQNLELILAELKKGHHPKE